MQIVAAAVGFESHPNEECPQIVTHYDQLVGLSIARGFTHRVRELFGGPRGCTHTTALLQAMAPVAVQCIWSMRASEARRGETQGALDLTPEQRRAMWQMNVNTCHVWAEDSDGSGGWGGRGDAAAGVRSRADGAPRAQARRLALAHVGLRRAVRDPPRRRRIRWWRLPERWQTTDSHGGHSSTGRAPGCDPGGWGFKSPWPPQRSNANGLTGCGRFVGWYPARPLASLAQWQSSGLLIHWFWVRIPGEAPRSSGVERLTGSSCGPRGSGRPPAVSTTGVAGAGSSSRT